MNWKFWSKKQSEPVKVKKDFNMDEFNNWFITEFDGYDGHKGAAGIFLRTDKLSPYWVEQYLDSIGQDTSYENIQKYYDIVRMDWIRTLNYMKK
jgi:hypothetical protein